MKNTLLTISLIANVALGGAVIYTSTEISKLNDQLESMQIANDQLQRKLEESNSTTAQSSTMEGAAAESSTATTEATTTPANVVYTIGDTNYNFPASGLTIEQDTSREGRMGTLDHEYPVLITDSNGTRSGWLIADNYDKNCSIMVGSETVYQGTQSSVYENFSNE